MNSPIRIKGLDIETVSQGKVANEYTDTCYVKTGNTKDPEKIKAAIAEKRDELRNQHGLHWWTGKVVSVALVDTYHGEETACFYGHDEKRILTDLGEYLSAKPMMLYGKESIDFDFPFLVGRYMANRIAMPQLLKTKGSLRDVNNFFGLKGSAQRGKLADYSHGMGLPSKLMHGGAVQDLYNSIIDAEMRGETDAAKSLWDKLVAYNIDDAAKVVDMVRAYYAPGRPAT